MIPPFLVFGVSALADPPPADVAAVQAPAAPSNVAPLAPDPEGRPLIYVYRKWTLVGAVGPVAITVDGVRVGSLVDGGCIAVRAAPGRHALEQRWVTLFNLPSQFDPLHIEANWATGGTYYYRFEIHEELDDWRHYPRRRYDVETFRPVATGAVNSGESKHCGAAQPFDFTAPAAASPTH